MSAGPDKPKRLLCYELRGMDAALKMVESLVTQGCQVAIAPNADGSFYTVSAPNRPGWSPPPVSGVAA